MGGYVPEVPDTIAIYHLVRRLPRAQQVRVEEKESADHEEECQ